MLLQRGVVRDARRLDDRRVDGKVAGKNRSSIIDSTSAVVPSLRYVEISDRLASPMITCSRRYFSGSACGSSRVLTIGRLSVVSSPTSTSK